jgi:ArsR family transcriptional regulator
MLSCGEMCACDILDKVNISQSTLSYHMKILTDCEIINVTRDGSWMRYSLNQERMKNVMAFTNKITSEKSECICIESKC